MKQSQKIWILAGSALVVLLLLNMKAWESILTTFMPQWEDFRSKPYWDYKQWSWGYGTKVPGSSTDPYKNPGGTITRAEALQAALRHVNSDYLYLKGLVRIPLKNNQWAALLSFSYNLGEGNADNLIANINGNNLSALEKQWKSYIYAGNLPNDDLIARRNAEWNLYSA